MRRTRGALSLVFDDGYTEIAEEVLPLLKRYGLRAVFAIPVNAATVARTECASLTALETWKKHCREEEHELAAHGVSHRPLPSLTDHELEEELRAAKEATGATTLAYPGGAHDDRVRRAAAKFFTAARGTEWGMETLPPADALRLRTFNATRKNFSVLTWNCRVLLAALSNRWCIETFHRVTDDPRLFHAVSLRDLERHLRFLTRTHLRIATIREILEGP
jgi:peptidoglycan/xylan/chitin deacetylase (PgdA/CDA1 family)